MTSSFPIYMMRYFLPVISIFICVGLCSAQNSNVSTSLKKTSLNQTVSSIKQSPAFAELLLRRTEREAQLEELLLDYTEEFPKVKELKFEIGLLQQQTEKLSAVSGADSQKLSLALGKLMVRKTELEVEHWNLLRQYNGDHPDVKRAKRKIEIYEKAIKEILP